LSNYNFYLNNFSNHARGIVILLKKNKFDNIIRLDSDKSGRIIKLNFKNLDINFTLLGVYSPTNLMEQLEFFNGLDFLLGDFNYITDILDKFGGNHSKISKNSEIIVEKIHSCNLTDFWKLLYPDDPGYTWCCYQKF